MLLIGSKALAFHKRDVRPKDTDIICFKSDIPFVKMLFGAEDYQETPTTIVLKNNSGFIECMLADNSEALRAYLRLENATDRVSGLRVARLVTLYSIKKSHIHFPIKFQKHIEDYCWMHKMLNGCDVLADYTHQNFLETEKRLGPLKTPKLAKLVTQFFDQSKSFFETWFVHDDIHKVMAHKDRPLYEYMQRDPTTAKCDKDLWEGFTFLEKCQCVLEEAYVIALERKIIPFIFGNQKKFTEEEALRWSLMRVCTTLTSGWFRQFATDNYVEIWGLANKSYVNQFLMAVDAGKVRLLDK